MHYCCNWPSTLITKCLRSDNQIYSIQAENSLNFSQTQFWVFLNLCRSPGQGRLGFLKRLQFDFPLTCWFETPLPPVCRTFALLNTTIGHTFHRIWVAKCLKAKCKMPHSKMPWRSAIIVASWRALQPVSKFSRDVTLKGHLWRKFKGRDDRHWRVSFWNISKLWNFQNNLVALLGAVFQVALCYG